MGKNWIVLLLTLRSLLAKKPPNWPQKYYLVRENIIRRRRLSKTVNITRPPTLIPLPRQRTAPLPPPLLPTQPIYHPPLPSHHAPLLPLCSLSTKERAVSQILPPQEPTKEHRSILRLFHPPRHLLTFSPHQHRRPRPLLTRPVLSLIFHPPLYFLLKRIKTFSGKAFPRRRRRHFLLRPAAICPNLKRVKKA